MKNILKSTKEKFWRTVIASIILFLISFLSLSNFIEYLNISHTSDTTALKEKERQYFSANVVSNDMCKYLSDIEYVKEQSKVEWGSITLDSNLETQYNNGLITLLVDGTKTYFLKGVSAHATSTLVYDLSEYNYDYFSTYIGVDSSRENNGNGVKFSIYTSTDGSTWDLKSSDNTKVFKGTTNAELVKIDLDGVRFLKLECNNNGNNASDHSVYADAKLCKNGYTEPKRENFDFIKTISEYDNILKSANLVDNFDNLTDDLEKTLLQRTLVNNVGYDLLQAIANQNIEYKETLQWLMNDLNNLRLYVLGGAPDGGSYYNSIKELSRLYHKYKDDFTDKTLTHNKWYPNLTKGEVYKKMAISLSLTHATKVGYWAQIDHPSNRSDSLKRYEIYKTLYDGNKFKVSERQDHTPWYEALTVEEMRYVMNNITDDEELIWFNDYTQKRINLHPNEEEKYLQPHTYIDYVYPNFENEIFHDPTKKNEWDNLFEGIFSVYKVTYSTENDHVYKAWMSMRNSYGTGAVCGGISKLGCHIRASHGTPASVISQPGHAAIIYYRKKDDGKGYWTIDNDVSGWAQSGKTEKLSTRMPLGWGNDEYVSGWAATYIVLAQEAINDIKNYEKSEEIIMLADVYEGDFAKQEKIYKNALGVQKINIDAWWGLIKLYKSDSTKKDLDYYNLANDLGQALMPFPLPMKNLLDQIQDKITTVEYSFKFTLLETDLLTKGKSYTDTDRVMQPEITRTVASFLLGQIETSLASFSFDGVDSGKIVLSSRFDNSGITWDYSIDGKKNWVNVAFSADEPHKHQLTTQEIEKITSDNDIYVHIVGTSYEDENLYKIDIEEQSLINNFYVNDLENRIIGIALNTEWRYKEGDPWISYGVSSPDLTGDKTVQIRQSATGNKLASSPSEMFHFTEDNQPDNRKYIRVSELSVEDYSSQSIDSNRPYYAENAIDGNANTLWHTDFRYNVKEDNIDTYITLKLENPKYLSAVEFIQKKYKDNDPDDIESCTVYVSSDGESWEEVGKLAECTNYNELQKISLNASKQSQYVKLQFTAKTMFVSLAMVNLFEDTTKIDKTIPTAGIAYSTRETTKDYVVARLVNPSTEITVTNNDGKDTYLFKENGEFKFEFEDKNGNKGSALAKVDWIDKNIPTADVDYKLDGDRRLLILLDNISEDVYLLDQDDKKINYVEVKDNNISRISYLDSNGNVYKIVEYDESGNITKITYTNTTGKVATVTTYVTTYEGGKVVKEEYFDTDGNSVTVSDEDAETLRTLEEVKTNPLEYTFEKSGDYQFKLLDKASNLAYKTIKVDYLEDDNILASDISYDITKVTNKNVIATINPYMINAKGEKLDVAIVNNNSSKQRTFDNNGDFVFQYKDIKDVEGSNIKEHTAKVDWIDKIAPTAEISYSTQESTNEPVTVSLVNESEEIIITNNSLNREYTFTENGDFTFEFEDKAGNVGTAIATVDWIKNDVNSENNGSQNGNQNNNGSESNGSQGNSGNANSGSQNGNQSNNGSGNSGNQSANGNTNSGNSNSSNNSGVGQSGSQNNNNFNINDGEKDYPESDYPKKDYPNDNNPLPQTGDINITAYILISLFSLIAIITLIKIKSNHKKN